MRNYFFAWDEEKNGICIRPATGNENGKEYLLTKENIVTYVLKTGDFKISSTLGGCLEYLSDKFTKEDALGLADMLYSWGQYNGAKIN
jgi:hypothetical protein